MSSYERELEQSQDAKKPAAATPDLPEAQRLASTVGNQAFSALARQGAGILPDGRAHPDVESAIARTRGGGQKLDDSTRERVGGGLGDSLHDVRVHTDDHASSLAQSVSARAFTTGSDVYFAKGEHNPGSSEGQQLLAHELTHVVQQRGAATSGPLQVSQPGDALENEAEAAAGDLVG
jgi:Domain of unknown function (DUF4157)